jgi:hypothetical protein
MIHVFQIPKPTTKLSLACTRGKTKQMEPLVSFDIFKCIIKYSTMST